MADEDGIYGGEDNDRFEAEEFDQDYVDGGIREDVRDSRGVDCQCPYCPQLTIYSLYSWTSRMHKIEWK